MLPIPRTPCPCHTTRLACPEVVALFASALFAGIAFIASTATVYGEFMGGECDVVGHGFRFV